MSFLRSSTAFSNLTQRAALSTRGLSTTPSRFAQGYGDGKGDPRGENPQGQGASNHEKSKREHPGPEPPSTDKGTGASPTKAGEVGTKSPEESSAQSGGSRSKDAKETGSSPTGGSVGGGNKSEDEASSKIQKNNQPEAVGAAKQAEVEEHNREFEQRHDRAPPAQEDKVDKKFWGGKGGGAEGD